MLMLTSLYGRALLTPGAARRVVRSGQVRYVLMGSAWCRPATGGLTPCSPPVRWARAHGVDVSQRAGLGRRGPLYELRAG